MSRNTVFWGLPSTIKFWPLLALIGLLVLSRQTQASPTARKMPASISVAADADVIADYRRFIAGRNPRDLQDFGGDFSRRDVVEIVLLYQALAAGGYQGKIHLVGDKSYLRILRSTKQGSYLMSAPLVWYSDVAQASESLWISDPLVAEGEFIAGIYTTPKNIKALAATSIEQLRKLRAVSNKHWTEDVHALESLGITQIYFSTYWVQMVRMLTAGRADITLAPFQNTADMSISVDNQKLVPIPGIKVALKGSRVWALSKGYPGNKQLFDILQRGLAQLKARGIIHKAYEQCGFFNPRVSNWTLLNAPYGSNQNASSSIHSN